MTAVRLNLMAAEDGSADDRAFFAANPAREYRARLATPYEAAAFEMLAEAPALPDEMFLWTLTRQLAPGFRIRRYVAGPPVGPRADIDEETARALFAAVEEGDA
jgi:hypothetical protein